MKRAIKNKVKKIKLEKIGLPIYERGWEAGTFVALQTVEIINKEVAMEAALIIKDILDRRKEQILKEKKYG